VVPAVRGRIKRRISHGGKWDLPNLRVVTGPAEYGHPEIQRVLEIA
jgi:hypothetical protein